MNWKTPAAPVAGFTASESKFDSRSATQRATLVVRAPREANPSRISAVTTALGGVRVGAGALEGGDELGDPPAEPPSWGALLAPRLESLLLLQLLDEVGNGRLQPLPPSPEIHLERLEADPLLLDLHLPSLERDEHIVVPLRDRIEERKSVLEIRERARAERRVDPAGEPSHVRLRGASIQDLLPRLDLS